VTQKSVESHLPSDGDGKAAPVPDTSPARKRALSRNLISTFSTVTMGLTIWLSCMQ
jgi:hypothetical protein